MADYKELKKISLSLLDKISSNLGSTNIKSTFHSKHIDKYITNEELLFKTKNRTVDTLIFDNLDQVRKDKLNSIRALCREYVDESLASQMPTKYLRFFLRNKLKYLSEIYGIGNCEELATQVFMLWCANYSGIYKDVCMAYFDMSDKYKFESQGLNPQDIDHIFVIIGYQEYGQNAIIIDPWLNKIYTLKELNGNIKYNIFNVPSSEIVIKIKFSLHDFIL